MCYFCTRAVTAPTVLTISDHFYSLDIFIYKLVCCNGRAIFVHLNAFRNLFTHARVNDIPIIAPHTDIYIHPQRLIL